MPTDNETLKLHVDGDGRVWFAAGDCVAVNSGRTLPEFLPTLAVQARPQVRILGTAQNAPLITESYPIIRRRSGQLELATPYICYGAGELASPALAIHRMRACHLPASLGGWHEATCADHAMYALVAYLSRPGAPFSEEAETLLFAHPAWHDLTFVPSLNREACARLLVEIVDPRWHIDPRQPNRSSRLFAYLGLAPVVQRAADAGSASIRARRCRLVQEAWKTLCPDTSELSQPVYFLWRVHGAAGGGPKGTCRASQKFVTYLRYTWVQRLYLDTRYGRRRELFAPEMLFKTPEELAAYRLHCTP